MTIASSKHLRRTVNIVKVDDPGVKADPLAQAALGLIDAHVGVWGTRHDNVVTERNLRTAEKSLASCSRRWKDLSTIELDYLETGMPKLEKLLRPVDDHKRSTTPFATAMKVSAILDPDVQTAAKMAAECFGKGNGEINYTELAAALRALESPSNLPKGVKTSVMTADRLKRIQAFFDTGKVDLVVHRNVVINGHAFDKAFPLNIDIKLDEKALLAEIEKVDSLLASSKYARVYFKSVDGRIYVAAGHTRQEISPGVRVQMGRMGNYQDGGDVIGAEDGAKTFTEATLGFWGNVGTKLTGAAKAAVDDDFTDTLANTADKTSANTGIAGLAAAGSLVAVGGTTALAGASGVLPAAALIVGGITLLNVAGWAKALTQRDQKAFYNAIGVTLGSTQKIH